MHELLGLNLLCLLSQNRIAEFHTVRGAIHTCSFPQELERLDPALLHDNIYIRHPVALEQVGFMLLTYNCGVPKRNIGIF